MAIFNSYVSLPEGIPTTGQCASFCWIIQLVDVWKSVSVTHFLRTDFLQPIHFFTASSLDAPNTCACSMCKQCAFRHITRVPLCLRWTHTLSLFNGTFWRYFLTSVLWAELAVRYCKGQLGPKAVRSAEMWDRQGHGEQCRSAIPPRGIPEMATVENPPGERAGSALLSSVTWEARQWISRHAPTSRSGGPFLESNLSMG